MAVAFRYLIDVARFAVVDLAHELRMDYERGVFSRQTLAIIGGSSTVAIASIVTAEYGLGISALFFAAFVTWSSARADRRWRDERRTP